jgi:hypothetical protein
MIFLLALVVVAAYLHLSAKPDPGTGPVDFGAPATPEIDVVMPVAPWHPPVEELNRAIREATQEDRVRVHGEALARFARLVRDRPHVQFKADRSVVPEGGFDRLDPARLLDPAETPALRARPVEFVGSIASYGPVDVEDAYGLDSREFPRSPYFQGTLVADGVEIDWLWLEESPFRVPALFQDRKWKLQGVFFRLSEVLVEDERFVARPLILAKKIVPVVPLQPLESLPEDFAEEVAWAEMERLAGDLRVDPTFLALVGYVLAKGDSAIPAGEEPLEWAGLDPLEDPAAWRLKPVRVRGQVLYMHYESFGYEEYSPKDGPAAGYWHAIISPKDPELNAPLSYVIPGDALPEAFRDWARASTAERQRMAAPEVEVRGIYYRLHAFESRGTPESRRRGETRTSRLPMVVAVGAPRLIHVPPDRSRDSFFKAYFVAAGVLALLFALLVARDRRRAQEADLRIRMSRSRRLRARGDLGREREPGLAPPEP